MIVDSEEYKYCVSFIKNPETQLTTIPMKETKKGRMKIFCPKEKRWRSVSENCKFFNGIGDSFGVALILTSYRASEIEYDAGTFIYCAYSMGVNK